MSYDEKIKNMENAIINSGFPLEIYTASILKSKQYRIVQHQYYMDDNEEKLREIDLLAEKSNQIDSSKQGTKLIFQNILIIECKKQDEKSPWLFFEGDNINTDPSSLLFTSTKDFLNIKWVADNIFPKSHYFKKIPCIYYIPPFKLDKNGKKTKDYIHDTILQLLSALKTTNKIYDDFQNKVVHKRVYFYYPIIVLDGDLFTSKIWDEETIEIVPSDHVQLLMNFTSDAQSKKWGNKKIVKKDSKLIIDIVTKEYLSDFIDNILLHGETKIRRKRLDKSN